VHRHDETRLQRSHDRGGGLATDGRAAAGRKEEDVDIADRAPLLVAQPGLAEVAEVTDPEPSRPKQKIVFGPRFVPATSSCSEATAITSPTGESNVPAVERRIGGEPPTASTAL
jgi:hypothetical protein